MIRQNSDANTYGISYNYHNLDNIKTSTEITPPQIRKLDPHSKTNCAQRIYSFLLSCCCTQNLLSEEAVSTAKSTSSAYSSVLHSNAKKVIPSTTTIQPATLYKISSETNEQRESSQSDPWVFNNNAPLPSTSAILISLIKSPNFKYLDASAKLQLWMTQEIDSPEELSSLFLHVKSELDLYRYKDVASIKKKIIDLLKGSDFSITKDVEILIDKVESLLKDLKIHYHNIQHTLEVTLGTTIAMVQSFKNEEIQDEKTILLAITAALFHDIGYSNSPEMLTYLKNLNRREYELLFMKAKDEVFIQNFEELVSKIKKNANITGAELQPYHVYLGQITMKFVLEKLESSLPLGRFLLTQESLENINAMISLTDIKPDLKKYRENRLRYLETKNISIAGKALKTSDLLTQLATADRLAKGLALYHEFFLAKEDSFWVSGLSLMATATGFYENFAKKEFEPHILSLFNEHFFSLKDGINSYQKTLELVFFLYKTFEPIYKKLNDGSPITNEDILLLEGLEKNGLQGEVITLFKAAKMLRENQTLDPPIVKQLEDVLREKDSVLEISIGDEIRITLLLNAAFKGDFDQIIHFVKKENLKKSEIFLVRSFDFFTAIESLHGLRRNLSVDILKRVNEIKPNTPGLQEFNQRLSTQTTL